MLPYSHVKDCEYCYCMHFMSLAKSILVLQYILNIHIFKNCASQRRVRSNPTNPPGYGPANKLLGDKDKKPEVQRCAISKTPLLGLLAFKLSNFPRLSPVQPQARSHWSGQSGFDLTTFLPIPHPQLWISCSCKHQFSKALNSFPVLQTCAIVRKR